ncbi:MAG: 8-amino-7-oxononanoate synthase, partial [Planctomycetia bacterium]
MVHLMQSPPSVRTTIDGKEYLYFSGTGYLGLHGHPRLVQAAIQATEQFGLGSATSRVRYGTTPPMADVEQEAAKFFG